MFRPGPHRTFHGLKIQSKLGEGAMGEAWLASHPVLRIPLVIKVYDALEGVDVLGEALLAARIQSPHVVGVLDAGISERPFVVQRYVDGVDGEELLHWLRLLGAKLPLDTALRIVVDLARGLHDVHQAGVIHRDLKPANCFLAADGTAMIGDFGIALDPGARRASRAEAKRTEARGAESDVERVVGTPSFIDPEVLAGRPVSRASDIYSLGVTAHLLASGELPREPTEVIVRRGRRPEVALLHGDPSQLPPLHEPYFAAVERMCAKQSAERFRSCHQIISALAPLVPPRRSFERVEPTRARVGALSLNLVEGDLTTTAADVLVSPASDVLWMDAGLARALRDAGGASIEQEALAFAPAHMGDVVWTSAGTLDADFIAHAVAAFDGAVCIGRAVLRVLFGAAQRRRRTIALPALGTGVGLVPMSLSARLTLEAVRTFAALAATSVAQVTIVLASADALATWTEVLGSC